VKAFIGGIVIGLAILGAFHTEIDYQSVNIGTNNTYCGFDWQHANAYCEHAE
jgi:hypothetical protein